MSKIPFAEIRAWMFERALPLWGGAGVDRVDGGFYEELDLSGAPTAVTFKRVRAMCRQVYVFSHAALLGWREGEALSAMGYDYIVRTAWQGAGRGWAKTLTRTGDVLDSTADLYDQAFALFALAWRYRLTRDPDVLVRAHDTLDFIEQRMRPDVDALPGFWSKLPGAPPRHQNPHMHLLEASLAMFEASADERFLDQARELVGLFRTRLFDGVTLGEVFELYWRRAPGEEGRLVEPGHQFEWAWILAQYARFSGDDVQSEAQALVDFAEKHGVDPKSGAVYNSIRDDGAPIDAGSRTWTNTERMKAWLALFELRGVDPHPAVAASTRLLLDRYFAVEPRGSWQDNFDAAGAPLAKAAPTSTFYHVFLAFAEALRLEPALR